MSKKYLRKKSKVHFGKFFDNTGKMFLSGSVTFLNGLLTYHFVNLSNDNSDNNYIGEAYATGVFTFLTAAVTLCYGGNAIHNFVKYLHDKCCPNYHCCPKDKSTSENERHRHRHYHHTSKKLDGYTGDDDEKETKEKNVIIDIT